MESKTVYFEDRKQENTDVVFELVQEKMKGKFRSLLRAEKVR